MLLLECYHATVYLNTLYPTSQKNSKTTSNFFKNCIYKLFFSQNIYQGHKIKIKTISFILKKIFYF